MAAPTPPRKRGRPPGSKTRADAPSKLKSKSAPVRDAAGHFLPAPAAAPEPAAAPAPAAPAPTASAPDTDLFGAVPEFAGEAMDTGAAPTPGAEPTPGTDPTPDAEPAPDAGPESQRSLATVCWDGIVGLLASFIGAFWHPRKMGPDAAAGEIPFDEREMVISAFMDYFHSIGLKVLTPAQKLWLAILAYATPRLRLTIIWLKEKFKKKPKPANVTETKDNRMPATEPPKPETAAK